MKLPYFNHFKSFLVMQTWQQINIHQTPLLSVGQQLKFSAEVGHCNADKTKPATALYCLHMTEADGQTTNYVPVFFRIVYIIC
jgi:hypothetical protein